MSQRVAWSLSRTLALRQQQLAEDRWPQGWNAGLASTVGINVGICAAVVRKQLEICDFLLDVASAGPTIRRRVAAAHLFRRDIRGSGLMDHGRSKFG
jgi:hypothetical protein